MEIISPAEGHAELEMILHARHGKYLVPNNLLHKMKQIKVNHLRSFGCAAYITIPCERKEKSMNQPNAFKCIMLGYTVLRQFVE